MVSTVVKFETDPIKRESPLTGETMEKLPQSYEHVTDNRDKINELVDEVHKLWTVLNLLIEATTEMAETTGQRKSCVDTNEERTTASQALHGGETRERI